MKYILHATVLFCCLSFSKHLLSQSLEITQHQLEYTIDLSDKKTPAIYLTVKETGLLIIEVKQQGQFLYERIWKNGKPLRYTDSFSFSEGVDYVSHQVKKGDRIGLEIQSQNLNNSQQPVQVSSYIVAKSDYNYLRFSELFSVVNKLGIKSYMRGHSSNDKFNQLSKKIAVYNKKILELANGLSLSRLQDFFIFNQSILYSELGKDRKGFDMLNSLVTAERDLKLLKSYYTSLLFPQHLSVEQHTQHLNKAIELSRNYNRNLYQNARLDNCTKLSNGLILAKQRCYQKIIDEGLLKYVPEKQRILTRNLEFSKLISSKKRKEQELNDTNSSCSLICKDVTPKFERRGTRRGPASSVGKVEN